MDLCGVCKELYFSAMTKSEGSPISSIQATNCSKTEF